MNKVALNFDLSSDSIIFANGKLSIDLGNGVRLYTDAPSWIESVDKATLVLILTIKGEPPDDEPEQSSVIEVH